MYWGVALPHAAQAWQTSADPPEHVPHLSSSVSGTACSGSVHHDLLAVTLDNSFSAPILPPRRETRRIKTRLAAYVPWQFEVGMHSLLQSRSQRNNMPGHRCGSICIINISLFFTCANAALLERLAFGSCHKQWKNTSTVWKAIGSQKPQVYAWLGDAAYAAHNDLASQRDALETTNRSVDYRMFRETLEHGIIGCYDDHDFGVNDGGGGGGLLREGVNDREQRKEAFLDFLGVGAEDSRWRRNGLYTVHTYGDFPKQVKVIVLDTRYSRSPHVVPSVGAVGRGWLLGKPMPLLAAMTRWLSVLLKLTANHDGSMLGEEQWRWLEAILASSDASVHILLSSVQVFSTNPLVESWGHFPAERSRLTALLRRHSPRGLVILSGDVHFGELIAATLGDQREVVEVTSSGLTHDCTDGSIPEVVCRSVCAMHTAHRPSADAFFVGENFGTIEIDWNGHDEIGGAPAMNFSVWHAKNSSAPVLTVRRVKRSANEPALAAMLAPESLAGLDPVPLVSLVSFPCMCFIVLVGLFGTMLNFCYKSITTA